MQDNNFVSDFVLIALNDVKKPKRLITSVTLAYMINIARNSSI